MNLIQHIQHIPHGIESIRQWLGDGGDVVPMETAEKRAAICVTCTANVQGFAVTERVAEAIRRHLEVKHALKLQTSQEDKLGTCGICSCALRLLINVPIDRVRSQMTEAEIGQTPRHCWKINETP